MYVFEQRTLLARGRERAKMLRINVPDLFADQSKGHFNMEQNEGSYSFHTLFLIYA